MKSILWINTALISLFTSQVISAQQPASPVILEIGPKKVTVDEFNRRYDEVRKRTINAPSKKQYLEDLARYEIGIQEAQKAGHDKDPVIIERMREELYKGHLEKMLGDKVSAITVSESEMKKYYADNPEVRTSHILIEVKPNATTEERAKAKARAEEIYQEVAKSKRPFEELVKLYSDDISSKRNGGDTGFQTRLSIYPTYYEAATRLKPGQISRVVETPFGFHIIKLVKKNSFESANRMHIRGIVFEKKKIDIFNDYFGKISKKYKVVKNEDLIK